MIIPRSWTEKLLWFDEADLFMWLFYSQWYEFGWLKFALAQLWFWPLQLISYEYRTPVL